jgi:predicted enzyme related to lactoylglutathione lyase
MGNPVVHFEVLGKDARALQQFYKEAFDWEIGPQLLPPGGPQYAMAFPKAELGINGGIGSGRNGDPGHVTFYVEVPDIEAALRKVQTLGGKTLMPAQPVPNGPTIALFTDPEGHLVGLVQDGTRRS